MPSDNQSFDLNEPIVPGDPKVIPPEDEEDDTVVSPLGEHAEQKGHNIHPPDQPEPEESTP